MIGLGLDIFFVRYRKKVDELIVKTHDHGDPYFAAEVIGIVNSDWITELLQYDGADPEIQEVKIDLEIARYKGLKNREAYAKSLFLDRLSKHASANEAVSAQPWFPKSYFEMQRGEDSSFAEAWAEKQEQAIDRLRMEAWRRATEGVDEPQVYKGQFQYQIDPGTGEEELVTVKKYSDGLLQVLLKRYDPAFRDKVQVDQTTVLEGGLTLDHMPQALAELSDSELETLKKFIDISSNNLTDDSTDESKKWH